MPIDLCERSIPFGCIVSQFNDCEHKSEYTLLSYSVASSSTLIGSQLQLQDNVISGSGEHYTDHNLERKPCWKNNQSEK
ncbi:hypothetical protein A3K86_09200 [Photobacterium jeanii]|uniref:Uncharacterized protein n=1 Tax=Photobacterium jeanii TaxID=858640 RepID=A0A178KHJ3_9GAMM|nr:hypothetical protein A3K86_09200 [Photobacterium jeanii]PST88386.1 hypothetical protein C9I91_17510 [Photobacterium jeanii]